MKGLTFSAHTDRHCYFTADCSECSHRTHKNLSVYGGKKFLERGYLETPGNQVKFKNMSLRTANCSTESYLFQTTVLQFILQKISGICAGHKHAYRLMNIFLDIS